MGVIQYIFTSSSSHESFPLLDFMIQYFLEFSGTRSFPESLNCLISFWALPASFWERWVVEMDQKSDKLGFACWPSSTPSRAINPLFSWGKNGIVTNKGLSTKTFHAAYGISVACGHCLCTLLPAESSVRAWNLLKCWDWGPTRGRGKSRHQLAGTHPCMAWSLGSPQVYKVRMRWGECWGLSLSSPFLWAGM